MSEELDRAKDFIAKKMRENVERCRARIEQILTEENCFIDVAMIITQRGVVPHISIKPKPQTPVPVPEN